MSELNTNENIENENEQTQEQEEQSPALTSTNNETDEEEEEEEETVYEYLYQASSPYEYQGYRAAFLDPMATEAEGHNVYMLSANATFSVVPNPVTGYAYTWDKNYSRWVANQDHRGTKYWLPGELHGSAGHIMQDLGPLPEGAVTEEPPENRAQKLAKLMPAVTTAMNTFAQQKDFASMDEACTYAGSDNLDLASYGAYAAHVRNETDVAAKEAYEEIEDDPTIEVPEPSAFVAELPIATASWESAVSYQDKRARSLTFAAGADLTLAQGDATLTSGDVKLTNGDVDITTGNVHVTTGNVSVASGNLVLSNGHAQLLKGNLSMSEGTVTMNGDGGHFKIDASNLNGSTGYANLFVGNSSTADAHHLKIYENGTITFDDHSIGGGGTITPAGSNTNPIYVNSAGTATALSCTVGDTGTPVYFNNGVITSTGKSFDDYLPLSGGTITGNLEVKNSTTGYKVSIDTANSTFKCTYDGTDYDIVSIPTSDYHGASAHNGIYRGKDLTSLYGSTAGLEVLHNKITNGDFSDLFIGDYIKLNLPSLNGTDVEEVELVFADFDYLYNLTTELAVHHIVMVTRNVLSSKIPWNSTTTCSTAHAGSTIYSTLSTLGTQWNGASYLNGHMHNSYKDWISDAMTSDMTKTNNSSTLAKLAPCLRLMNEIMVTGSMIFSSSGFDIGRCCSQLSLFRLCGRAKMAMQSSVRSTFWLSGISCRSTTSKTTAVYLTNGGIPFSAVVTDEHGVRPFFLFI